MRTGFDFVLAAKRCEIDGLQRLSATADLVEITAHLVHQLQRERGLSTLFLASGGQRHAELRLAQIEAVRTVEASWRDRFGQLDTSTAQAGHGARQFSRIAYVLQGLDSLDALRERVQSMGWDITRTTAAFVQLISALLAVVFEAADSATDPTVSRRLVALFNFMQGKEFAGQERAAGSALFSRAHADGQGQQQMLHLIESQERCFELYEAFAAPAADARTEQTAASTAALTVPAPAPIADLNTAKLERLRRLLCTATPGSALRSDCSQEWFDACSDRIDALKRLEDHLLAGLRAACSHSIALAQDELQSLSTITAQKTTDPLAFFVTTAEAHSSAPRSTAQGFGLQLERSALELVHDQARRLQAVSDELAAVRATLTERRLIERAKGVLIAHRQITEAEAHKVLRQMSMNQNRRLVDAAEAVLAMAQAFPSP